MTIEIVQSEAAPETPASGIPTWLQQLTEHGLLRWQHSENNIGLLLAQLLDVNGWQGDILSLCDALPSATHSVGVEDVLAVMGALGYRIHRERIHSGALKAEDLPGLFIPAGNPGWCAGMVVRELGAYGLIWEDGRMTHRGQLPAMEGCFYRFERINLEEDEERTEAPANWVHLLADRFRPLFWHAAVLSLAMQLFTLAMPMFSMAVYDRVIAAHAPGSLPLLAAGVLMALGAEHIIRWLRVRLAGWIGARSGLLATGAMFERLLFLPASVIEQASVSAQLARIRAFESVRDFITGRPS